MVVMTTMMRYRLKGTVHVNGMTIYNYDNIGRINDDNVMVDITLAGLMMTM